MLSSLWDADKLGPDSFRKRENVGKCVWRRGFVPGAGPPGDRQAVRAMARPVEGRRQRAVPMMPVGEEAGLLP